MWDEFKDHPMRKDYVEPDDYEYEPTAHDEVLERGETALHGAAITRRRGEHHGTTAMSATIDTFEPPNRP